PSVPPVRVPRGPAGRRTPRARSRARWRRPLPRGTPHASQPTVAVAPRASSRAFLAVGEDDHIAGRRTIRLQHPSELDAFALLESTKAFSPNLREMDEEDVAPRVGLDPTVPFRGLKPPHATPLAGSFVRDWRLRRILIRPHCELAPL